MADTVAGGGIHLERPAKNLGRRRAAGIYGAIITAAILDTAGAHLPTAALVVSVVVTLLVYWLAEEYAEMLGEQVQDGQLPGRARIRASLAATWPMVSASYLPLLAQLRSWQLFFATSAAALLGVVMILLKDLVLTHLH